MGRHVCFIQLIIILKFDSHKNFKEIEEMKDYKREQKQ